MYICGIKTRSVPISNFTLKVYLHYENKSESQTHFSAMSQREKAFVMYLLFAQLPLVADGD